ncbi:MAG: hypothetical protein ABI605_20080 [Rhizobacter sp.]
MESALVWRLRQWFGLRLYGIYARDLGGAIADFSPALVGYSHRIFEAPDAEILQALAGAPTLDMSESFMKSAFGKGDACDAVIFAGKLVSYSWMAFTPTRDSGSVFVEFGPRYRYVYKAFTLPEFRGRHAIRQFKVDSDQYCVQRGRVATIAFISIDNQPSIRYALGVGNRRIGHAGYLKFGSVFFSFRTPGVKRAGFRFFERRLG